MNRTEAWPGGIQDGAPGLVLSASRGKTDSPFLPGRQELAGMSSGMNSAYLCAEISFPGNELERGWVRLPVGTEAWGEALHGLTAERVVERVRGCRIAGMRVGCRESATGNDIVKLRP